MRTVNECEGCMGDGVDCDTKENVLLTLDDFFATITLLRKSEFRRLGL